MKKLYFIILVFFISLFLGCNVLKPVNPHPDTDIPVNRNTLVNKNDNIDSVIIDNSVVSFYNPYKNKGQLHLKGAMHTHPHELRKGNPVATAEMFRDIGNYDFYAFSDHDFITFDPKVPGIVWMGNSTEDTKNRQHLNIYNLPTGYKWVNKGGNIHKLIEYYSGLGAFISLNHPNRAKGRQSNKKILSLSGLDFVEIKANTPGTPERALDLLLSKGDLTFGLATDDYHFRRRRKNPAGEYDSRQYIIAFAQEKEKASIWKALLSGCFYMVFDNARMDISCENGIINVSSNMPSLFEFIGLNSERPGAGKILYKASDVTEASYAINGTEGYIRVRVTNTEGRAFSQAFMILP